MPRLVCQGARVGRKGKEPGEGGKTGKAEPVQ